eukprot:1143617-Pelagomonas_calceolata.AAC.8
MQGLRSEHENVKRSRSTDPDINGLSGSWMRALAPPMLCARSVALHILKPRSGVAWSKAHPVKVQLPCPNYHP